MVSSMQQESQGRGVPTQKSCDTIATVWALQVGGAIN